VSILAHVLTPSRLAAGSRLTLLAVLLVLVGALAPAAPGSPHPVHAAAPAASAPAIVAPAATREPPDQAGQPALHPLRAVISFRDASGQLAGAPATVASSGILVDIDTNEVLWALEPHAQRAPASTTKLVSSIVALENFPPDRVVVVQPAAVVDNLVETRMGLHAGERLTIRELLSGMLTVSANDAARAIPDGTLGMEQYVEAMNEQVTALGLTDSHFTNPVGYPDDPQMVSSAYDLAAFATAAYRNYPLFRELTANHDANLPATPTHQEFKMHNINRLLDIYPPAVGTKSGYTDLAGPCLVSEAVRDNHHLVAVLMNSQKMFDQSKALLEWGFKQEGLPALYPPTGPQVARVTSPAN
jgi:serine-type D-Ala-D-Ala carboxypeptidase (penicillin-binding protein 5/6)